MLRRYLTQLGYHVHPWNRSEILALHRLSTVALKRMDEIAAEADAPVSMIGHSLGGIYAREIARAHGGDVDKNLMFAGHSAFRFKTDPFYSNGFVPSVKQLVDRILTGA